MAEFPALPLFTDAYLGDTTHLTTTEHGAYLLLLIVAWRSGGELPDNDALLARYTRLSRDKWRKVRVVLEPFFRIEGGFWRQARLQDELQHLRSQRKQQSEAGRASARAKALKRANRDATDAEEPLQRNANGESTPTPTPTSVDKSTAAGPLQNGGDPVKEIFDLGVSLLVEAGVEKSRARSLLGKWRKAKGDGDVLAGLLECRRQAVSDPVEWLTKRFAVARYVAPSGYEYRGDLDAVIREAERRADWGTYWKAKGDRDKRPAEASSSR